MEWIDISSHPRITDEPIEFVPMQPDQANPMHGAPDVRVTERLSREPPPLLTRQEKPKHMNKTLKEQFGIPASQMEAGGRDPGMDIDVVDTPEIELVRLLSVMTRDAADEIKRNEEDIIGVVRALGS